MFGKKFSLIIVGESQDKLRQLRVSYGSILISAFLITFLLGTTIILTTSFVNTQVSEHEAERLRMENGHLITKYDELQTELGEISAYYKELVDKEVLIRDIFRLPEISDDERQLGIGGPDNSPSEQFSEAIKAAYMTERKVDELLRLSRFETKNYDEVYKLLLGKKDLLNHTPSILPAKGYHTRGFGMKHDPFTGYKQMHWGLDIANKTGTPIYVTADGVVAATGRTEGIGIYILVDHGFGYKTKYGHLSGVKVNRGQQIRRGDLIGLMGSTGWSTGPHLHYEVLKDNRRIDPVKYILNQ